MKELAWLIITEWTANNYCALSLSISLFNTCFIWCSRELSTWNSMF